MHKNTGIIFLIKRFCVCLCVNSIMMLSRQTLTGCGCTNVCFPPFLSSLVSVSLQKSVKEGILLKQTSSFQRWKRRYFKLRGRTLYYAKDCKVHEPRRLQQLSINTMLSFF